MWRRHAALTLLTIKQEQQELGTNNTAIYNSQELSANNASIYNSQELGANIMAKLKPGDVKTSRRPQWHQELGANRAIYN